MFFSGTPARGAALASRPIRSLVATAALLLALPAAAQSPLSVTPSAPSQTLGPNATATQTLTVTNTGTEALTFAAARGAATAPAGGPDAYGYTWTDSDRPGGPVYRWVDIRETGTRHTMNTATQIWVDLPFAFPFYGQPQTRVKLYAQGLISFLPTYQSFWDNYPIPYWDAPDLFIAGFWDSLNPSRNAGGAVYTGTDDRGRFVVTYHDVALSGSSSPASSYTFQIILDPSGTIVIQYGTMDGPTNSATVGIENATSVHGGSSTGLQVVYNQPYVREGLAVRIARGDPWMTVLGGGDLAPGASTELALGFDSHNLASGTLTSQLALTSPALASPLQVPVSLTVLPAPAVAVSASALDFGDVYMGAVGRDSLVVTNVGSAPLSLASVATDGPPFAATLSGSSVLAPGESRLVSVTFTPSADGPAAGTLTVASDDPTEPSLSVALAGVGLLAPSVSVSPPSLSVALGVGETTTETVTLANGGASDLTFDLRFRHPGGGVLDSLYYDFGTPTAGTTGWSPWQPFAVANRFTADGAFHLTDLRAFLRIEHDPTVRFEVYGAGTFGDPTSGPRLWSRDVAIPHGPAAMYQVPLDTTLTFADGEDFYIVIWTQGEFSPFGTHHSNGGRSYRRTYHGPTWHHETGSATYVIRAVSTLDAALALEPASGTVPAGGSLEVAVTIGGPALPGGQHATSLVVATNDPAAPEVLVPLAIGVSGVPMLVTTPDSLAFGDVYLGQTGTRSLRVRNLGTAPLTISAVASSDASVTVAPAAPLTLGVGMSETLTVAFQPVEAGAISGTLTITSDDPATPTATVAFAGEGVAYPSIAVAPDSVFVALLAGDAATATVTLTNDGPGPLTYAVEGFTGDAPGSEPDGFGYTWTDSTQPGGPAFHWVDISQTGTALALGDNTFADVDLPFLFPFYGDAKMSIRIASNGYLTFGNQRGDIWHNRPIPHNWAPNDLIAVLWADIDPTTSGTVYHGTDAQGRFVVQYDDVSLNSSPTWRATFQAILDPGGNLLFQYRNVDGPWSSTIGIENADATDGLQVSYNAFPTYARDSLAVRIDAPTPWLTSVTPATGTLASGESAEVTLALDAEMLEQGEYVASVRIASNDPVQPLVRVPVVLEVSGTLRLPLAAGWNLVSWNVAPADQAVESVLAGILDRVLAVETYEGGERRTYVPGQAGNGLTSLMPTYGYWIKMSAPALLEIEGTPVDRQHALALNGGANAVPYLPWHASGVGHALGSVLDVTRSAASFQGTGLTYAPGVPDAYQVLDSMRPKAGYVLRTMAPGTLVYPTIPGASGAGSDERPTLAGRLAAEQAAGVTPTMAWLDVWASDVRSAAGLPLPVDTRVTARDAQGRAVGAFDVLAEGRMGLMALYADDPYTPEKDGALPGETLTFFAGEEVIGTFIWTAEGDVVDLSGLLVSTGDGRSELPTEFDLAANHPNPFHEATTIRYALPEATHVRLSIYDALGRLVATLVDEERPAGRHEATWSARALASGVYVYRIEAGPFQQSRRMLVVR